MDFWLILGLIGVFGLGIGATWGFLWLAHRYAQRLKDQENARKGVQAKVDDAADLMAFMLEVKAAWDSKPEDMKPLEFGMQVLPKIALSHPRVMLRFGGQLKKLVEGKNGSFLDLSSLNSLTQAA